MTACRSQVGQQQLAQLAVGLAGAEEHTIGHDDAGAALVGQVVEEPFEEQQLRVARC